MSRKLDALRRPYPRFRWEPHYPTVIIPSVTNVGAAGGYGSWWEFDIRRGTLSGGPERLELNNGVAPLVNPGATAIVLPSTFTRDEYLDAWELALSGVQADLIEQHPAPENGADWLDWARVPVGNSWYIDREVLMVGARVFGPEGAWFGTTAPDFRLLNAYRGYEPALGILGPRRVMHRGEFSPFEPAIEWIG